MIMTRWISQRSKFSQPRTKFEAIKWSSLPSTDPDQPHFLADPAGRHRETHFRLRHDIFGMLKQALGGLLLAIKNDPALLRNPKPSLGDVQVYAYPNAHIRYISYGHRRGFAAQISFPQLSLLRKKAALRTTYVVEGIKTTRRGHFALLCTSEGSRKLDFALRG
jgi:hypothetical protein